LLRVAIVGGGPSGLLLAHRLLQAAAAGVLQGAAAAAAAQIVVLEQRPRPSSDSSSRAYALGLGRRGRTAIQSVDEEGHVPLWRTVQQRYGFASDTFDLHWPVNGWKVRLRHGTNRRSSLWSKKNDEANEPSWLLFQSDLCQCLSDELEARAAKAATATATATASSSVVVDVRYETRVVNVNLRDKTITTVAAASSNKTTTESFDLIVGCDGVNSVVRQAMADTWPNFMTTGAQIIPGHYKVVRTPFPASSSLDPTAVALLLPQAGTCTAFIEPTAPGSCCILFAGRNASDPLLSSSNTTELVDLLRTRFPKLVTTSTTTSTSDDPDETNHHAYQDDPVLSEAAQQLAARTKTSQAKYVECNTFHYSGTAVLCGDAAHATGGISGQGVNSALVDSAVLADALIQYYDANNDPTTSLQRALLSYSQQQVPEGKALYDLSLGPNPKSWFKQVRAAARLARDYLFQGRWGIGDVPLQTKMTTSLIPFAELRRQRNGLYDETFLSPDEWNQRIEQLHRDSCVQHEAAMIRKEEGETTATMI